MQVGCFGGLVFSVDSNKVFTMQDIQGSTGSDWATHNTINGKPKSELTGQKLKAYKFTVTLDAQYGVKPREMLANIQRMAEEGTVDYLIIGSDPVGMCLFKLTDPAQATVIAVAMDALEAALAAVHLALDSCGNEKGRTKWTWHLNRTTTQEAKRRIPKIFRC